MLFFFSKTDDCDGKPCDSFDVDEMPCFGDDPRDCVMTDWGEWGLCNAPTCGVVGKSFRYRSHEPPVGCGGKECDDGDLEEDTPCEKEGCGKYNCSLMT